MPTPFDASSLTKFTECLRKYHYAMKAQTPMTQLRSILLHPSFLTGLRDGLIASFAAGLGFILGCLCGAGSWYPA